MLLPFRVSPAEVSLTSYKALKWYGGAPYGRDVTVLILGGSGGCGSTGIQLAKVLRDACFLKGVVQHFQLQID